MNIKENVTDEELALSYIEGDNRAFDLLLERNQAKLFSYILFVVRDPDKANDIFQETFIKVITRLHQNRYVPTGKFSAWITRIAHNIMMDRYRAQKMQNIIEPTADNDISNISSHDLMDMNRENKYVNDQVYADVRNLMNRLPPTQREVAYLRFYRKMSFKSIAQVTGVSINTSLGRMRYAILNMRRMVKEHDIELRLE